MSNKIIGIEGLVGAGKTSICRELLKIIPDSVFINCGNLYRAIVAVLIKNGNTLSELKDNASQIDLKQLMDYFKIEVKIENNETIIYCENEKLDEELLQSKEISLAVSSLGGKTNEGTAIEFLRNLVKDLSEKHTLIISGRGIMKLFPQTDYHLFIIADTDVRAERKHMQYPNIPLEEVRKNIIERDMLQKRAGYYDLHEISQVIDVTECKDVKESTNLVLKELDLNILV